VPRVSDLYAALPGITGKLELEYEGEMRGADTVVRDLIRAAVGKVYDRYFSGLDTQQIEQWFNLGGTVKLDDDQPTPAALADLKQIHGLLDKLSPARRQAFRFAARRRCRGRVPARRPGRPSQDQPQRRARL
jgi:magnesium chelatase subunit I